MKLLRFILYALAWIAAALCAIWAVGALYFDFPKAGVLTNAPAPRTGIRISRASSGKVYRGAISKSRNERRMFKLHISPVI